MGRMIALGVLMLAVVVFGFSLIDSTDSGEVSASAVMTAPDTNISGFQRAVGPWEWRFPQDYGAHPGFQTEWWYYTGNLSTDAGRRFGYQFTIFRRAISPVEYATESEWRVKQIYMAHFTVSDIQANEFHHAQRYSRGGAGLAGAVTDPLYRVWLEDWQVVAWDPQAQQTTITAGMAGVSIDLNLEQFKPPALQGENGLSAKGEEPGNASYYYSLSRLLTAGTLTIDGERFEVSGTTWMDHEFSTSALGSGALGWDWFGLHLDGSRELMVGQIRLLDGRKDPYFGGLLVSADGSTQTIPAEDIRITPTGRWESPHTGTTYPAGWEIEVRIEGEPLSLTLTPLMADQELHGGSIAYWEGAVRISGDAEGYGYAELTGYGVPMTNRF